MTTELIEHRQTLQAELESLNIKADIAQLEDALRHRSQGQSLIEGFGDYIDPMESIRGNPEYFGGFQNGHVSRPDDRSSGDNAPVFKDEQALAFIRGAGEWISQSDATAVGALEALASYVIGTGFTWTAESDDPEAAQIVQRIVDEFCERVDWCGGLDRELFKRTRKSGERFVRLHQLAGGVSDIEVYEPSWIMRPNNPAEVERHWGLPAECDWKYGVCTVPGRSTMIYGFSVFRHGDPTEFEYVPVDEMSHVKINVDRNVKRGVSDFYVAEEWLSKAAKLLRRTLDGGAIQASIALIRKWNPQASQANINAAAESVVKFQTKLPNYEGQSGPANIPTEQFYSGKIVDKKGVDYEPGPMGSSNAPTYMDIAQAGLRKAANRWQMPEFIFTGDASNANYSSTLVSESPFVKFCEHLQSQTVKDDSSVFWRVVKHAAEGGRTRGYGYQDLKQLVTLDAAAPDVASRNRAEENSIRQSQHAAGILSRESWSMEVDRDYHEERKKIEQEPQPVQANPTQAAAIGAALESVSTTTEARAILESYS